MDAHLILAVVLLSRMHCIFTTQTKGDRHTKTDGMHTRTDRQAGKQTGKDRDCKTSRYHPKIKAHRETDDRLRTTVGQTGRQAKTETDNQEPSKN